MRRLSVGFVVVAAFLFASHPSIVTTVHAAGLAAGVVVFADGTGTRTSPPFSVSPGDVVVAFVASDGPPSGSQTMTVSGGGLTWTLTKRVNVQAGTSEIWRAVATSAMSGVTAISTPALGGYHQSLTVVTFSGASGTGATGGASAASGAPTVALTTTAAGSLVYGVGNDWDKATPRTLGGGQALVHQYPAPAGDLLWVQNQIAPSSAAGVQVQLNDIAPTIDRWNFAAVEIVPAGPPGFEVKPYNDSITLGLSDALAYNLLLDPLGGFTGSVSCTVAGLPADTTGTFEPPGGPPHPGPFALTVTTTPATLPGTYQPIVTCLAGALSASKTLALTVTASPDYRVVMEPNSLILNQGQEGIADFQIQRMNDYPQAVNLSASGAPSGVSATFTPAAVFPTGAGTVRFTVSATSAPGVYPISIVATANDQTLVRTASFQLTVLQSSVSGSWRELALGDTPAKFYGVIVGDVGNTGKSRVFASGGQGAMYEYAFDGISWSFSRMPVGVLSDDEMHNMAIGPARGDGINRLYIAVSGGDKVYECSWVSSAWQCPIMVSLAGATDVIIGDGRNDGRTRMYVTAKLGVTEFTWNGSSWTSLTMSTDAGWAHGIDLGQGRSDGLNRVYTANQGNGDVFEYSWNGSSWTRLLMGNNGDSRNIEVAEGRNDGKIRVYVPSGDSNVYEFTWTGSTWQKASLGNAGATGVKVQGIPAKARSDNLIRIYGASSDAGVDEYTWTGSAWQTRRLGAATAYMYGLAAGDGLNDGTTQIYGASYDGQAYLFQWVPGTPVVVVPSVVTLTQTAATTALQVAGLTVGTVTSAPSATIPLGSVISQNPASGAQVAPASPVNLVVSSGQPSTPGLTVDSLVFSDGSGTRTTPAFSTPAAGEVLVAFVASDGPTSGGQSATVSGAGVTWTLVKRANTQLGTAEIWTATAAAPLTNVTVRSVQARTPYHQSLTVVVFGGSAGIGTSSVANGTTGAPTVPVVTTKPGSLVYAVGNDWNKAIARVLGAGQTVAHQWVDTAVGDTFWVQAVAAAVPAVNTAVQLNDTSPTTDQWNFAAVEITRK